MLIETLPRLLLLEDDHQHVRIIEKIFHGHAVIDVAKNSSEFLAQLEVGNPVSLCILDNRIYGDLNFKDSEVGIRILEILRDIKQSDIPVIFSTAEALNRENTQFVLDRATMYPKPFNSIDELLAIGMQLIEEHQHRISAPELRKFIITSSLEEPIDVSELGDTILVLRVHRILDQSTISRFIMRRHWTPIAVGSANQLLINIQGLGIQAINGNNVHIPVPTDNQVNSEIRIGLAVYIANHADTRTLDIQLFEDTEFRESIKMSVSIHTETAPSTLPPKIVGRLVAANRLIDPKKRTEPILTLNWRGTRDRPIGTLIGTRLMKTEIDNLSLKDFEAIRKKLLAALVEVEKRVDSKPIGSDGMAMDRVEPLVEAGYYAFRTIFQSGELRSSIGRLMHTARVSGSLPTIRIITDKDHLIPWDLLFAQYVDWNNDTEKKISQFWGMGCVVEHMLLGRDALDDVMINNSEKTQITMLRHNALSHPKDYELKLIARAEGTGRLDLLEREHKGEDAKLKEYLELPANIIQFVGHGDPEEDLPNLNRLDLGDGAITPLWLNTWDVQFSGQPLVIMNACEGLAVKPGLYGGFLESFLDCGARGVLGTLVPIRAIFASRFTTNFYEDFLDAKSAGEALYFARWNCWDKSRSLLGLLYTYYGSLYVHLQKSVRTKKLDVCSACLAGKACSASSEH